MNNIIYVDIDIHFTYFFTKSNDIEKVHVMQYDLACQK